MRTKKYIVMVGPSINSHGGIASAVSNWKSTGLFVRWPIIYLETHAEGSKISKFWIAGFALLRFVCLLVSKRVACIHIHVARHTGFWRKSIFALTAFAMHRPVLLHLHSGRFPDFFYDDCNWLQKRIVRFVLDEAHRLIVLTESWREILRPISTNHRITVITNFPVLPLHVPNDATRAMHHVLFLGLLTRDKGFFDLLEAIAPLCKELPSLLLLCGGDGNQVEANERIQRLRVENHIKLLGWVTGESKEAWLSHASVFVLPSYVEAIPMGILEAMAWGMPVVATKIGGIPDIVEHGQEGLLIEPGDIDGLRNALRRLLQNNDERRRMGHAARRKVELQFSSEAVIPRIDLLYQEYCRAQV